MNGMIWMKRYGLIIIMVIFMLTGCKVGAKSEEVKPLLIGTNKIVDQTKADKAKQLVLAMNEIIEVKGVNIDGNIYIAARVKQFDRLFLERIRKQAHDKVKKKNPNTNIHISTDKKVFMELEKLETKIKNSKIDRKTVEKEIKKIEKFMKG